MRVQLRIKGPGKREHIVAHDVSQAAQTGKHLLRTQNVSEKNQKQFLCPGHKIYVRNKCCALANGVTFVLSFVLSATMCPRLPGPLHYESYFGNSIKIA